MNPLSFRLALISSILALAVCLPAQTQEKQNPKAGSAPVPKQRKPASKPAGTPLDPNPFDAFQQFSALLNGGFAEEHDRKIYRSGRFMRLDFEGYYRITDLKKLETWSVAPNRCAQIPMPDAGSYPFSAFHDFKAARSLTGEKETVDGHVCRIENVTFTPNDERPIIIKMKLWEAEDLEGFPIKIDVDAGGGRKFNLTYTDVSLKAPDPKLFQHPAKCEQGPQPGQKGTIKLAPPPPKAGPKASQKPQ